MTLVPALSCTWAPPGQPDPSACTNTSTGGGLKLAAGQFGLPPIRQESVWVVILLTDGAANASETNAVTGQSNKYCPASTWWDQVTDPNHYDPFCRDSDPTTRHSLINPTIYGVTHTAPYNPLNTYDPTGIHYDADDYARDNADFVSCAAKQAVAAQWCQDSLNYTIGQGGQGALMFSIGLGSLLSTIRPAAAWRMPLPKTEKRASVRATRMPAMPRVTRCCVTSRAWAWRVTRTARMPAPPWPPPALVLPPDKSAPRNAPTLASAGNLSYNCGNYYFAQFGTGLNAIFESIASRIFTRITQ